MKGVSQIEQEKVSGIELEKSEQNRIKKGELCKDVDGDDGDCVVRMMLHDNGLGL